MRVVLQLCLYICGIFASSIVDNNNTYKDCVNTVLMCSGSAENCKRMYRKLAKEVHFDKTGLDDSFMMFLNSKKPICTSKHAWSQCSDARTSCLPRETVEPKKMHDVRKSKKMHDVRKSKNMHDKRKKPDSNHDSNPDSNRDRKPDSNHDRKPDSVPRIIFSLLIVSAIKTYGPDYCHDGQSNFVRNLQNYMIAWIAVLLVLNAERII